MALRHHGALVILGAGGMAPEGPTPSNPKAIAMIPLPKGFDLGDTQPGGTLDVTAHCQLSGDGKHLEVLSVDGSGADDDDEDDQTPDAGGGDSSDTPGSRWAQMDARRAAAQQD